MDAKLLVSANDLDSLIAAVNHFQQNGSDVSIGEVSQHVGDLDGSAFDVTVLNCSANTIFFLGKMVGYKDALHE